MSQAAAARAASHVLTLEEISHLVAETGKPADPLMNAVALIARRFQTDVCSAYLLEPDRANLVLAASLGLRPQCIGTLRMALNEGLAGLVAEQVRPVAVEQVTTHPRFKYFTEAGEDAYHSFLGVPLIDQGVLQGVLVVQTKEARIFAEDEVAMLVEAAAEVASIRSAGGNSITIPYRCCLRYRWRSSSGGRASWRSTGESITPTSASKNIFDRIEPGARRMPVSCGPAR